MGLCLTFIGPPGSGKGTQAKLLREDGFLHVSSGDMLRAEIAAATPRGRAIEAAVTRGELVSDAVLLDVVGSFLAQRMGNNIVLDGYPRTVVQAEQLAKLKCGPAPALSAAVFFDIPDQVLLRRLGDRVIGPDGTIYDLQLHPPPPGLKVTRRADDDPEVHKRRLATYRSDEAALLAFYEKAGIAHHIQAELPLDEVRAQVQALIARLTPAAV
jgi:adenylate kinase